MYKGPIYYVMEAELSDFDGAPTGERFTFAVSNVRLVSLMQEIEAGTRLIVRDSLNPIYVTNNRNLARHLAGGSEL